MGGHTDVVELLIAHGASVNAASAGRKTALHGAAMNGHIVTAKLLLQKGASQHVVNDHGETAADLAYTRHHHKLHEILGGYEH